MSEEAKGPDALAVEEMMLWAIAASERWAMMDKRYADLKWAHRNFLFAANLLDAAAHNRITPAMLADTNDSDNPYAIRSRDLVSIKIESDQDGLVHHFRELFLSTWQRAIIYADEALTTLARDDRSLAQDTNYLEVQLIVKAMRHAFAHSAMQPRWDIKNKNKQRIYKATMDDGHIMTLDAATLNGKLMDKAQHDGWQGIDRLLTYALRRAKEHVDRRPAAIVE